jgi:hypothetical protein
MNKHFTLKGIVVWCVTADKHPQFTKPCCESLEHLPACACVPMLNYLKK